MPAEPVTAGAVDADQFAALCNLFCLTGHGGDAIEPAAEEIGDVLYYRAHPMTCEHSLLMTRAILAFLGLGTGDPDADELISKVHAAMRNGKGSLPSEDDKPRRPS